MGIESLSSFADDGSLNVVVETPRGSTGKFKFDRASGLMKLARPLPFGIAYPYDWGFVPGTQMPDGDPLDAMILWEGTGTPGLLIVSRCLGILHVEQNSPKGARQRNDRLVVVPVKAPRQDAVRSVADLAERTRAELQHFFTAVVAFEAKQIALLGWEGPEEALALVRKSRVQPSEKLAR